MNKPAAKEPSMDEILSSIRQIIADEDQGASTPSALAEEVAQPDEDQDEPLALSAEQMVSVPEPENTPEPEPAPIEEPAAEDEVDALSAMTIADDVAFAPDEPAEDPDVAGLANMLADTEADVASDEDETADIVLADDIGFDGDEVEPEPVRAAAPMPDPDLSSDIAEKLLEPTAAAASKHAFSRLNKLSIGAGDLTIENMVREMLRPMLKEWLDENLPGVVEKLVEREIERISRGS